MSYLIIEPGDERVVLDSIVQEFKPQNNVHIDLSRSAYNTQDRLYELTLQVNNSTSTATKSVSPFKEAIAILITNDKISITTPEKVRETMF